MLSYLQFIGPRYYFCTCYFIKSLLRPKFKILDYFLFRVRQRVKEKVLVHFFHKLTFEHPVYNIANFLGQHTKTKMIILCILLYFLRGAKFYNKLRKIAIHYNFRGQVKLGQVRLGLSSSTNGHSRRAECIMYSRLSTGSEIQKLVQVRLGQVRFIIINQW